ncbi:hypothetical protein AnigIFM50267_000637 [Aspergillus niger]|nr:hypothetical protein AnigIFM50267_000637 [Aspergillus niger]
MRPLTLLLSFVGYLAILSQPAVAASYYSALSLCPLSSTISGPDPANWTYYHDMASLTRCNETVLFDLDLNTAVDDPLAHQTFRACTTADFGNSQDLTQRRGTILRQQLASNITVSSSSSTTTSAITSILMDNIDVSWWSVTNYACNTHAANGFASRASKLENYLTRDDTCGKSVLFSQAEDVVMGVYIGSQYTKTGAAQLLSSFQDHQNLLDKYVASQLALEDCGDKSIGPEIIGVFIETTGNISAVPTALRGWNEAKCQTGSSGQELWTNVSLSMIPPSEMSIVPGMTSQTLSHRDTCSYTQAVAGDGSWSLAERCGIAQDDLDSYNPVSDICNTIEVGQYVCCSFKLLPDYSPQSNDDGSCYTYTIEFGDLCSTIGSTYNIPDATKIEGYNSETWGWEGCLYLMIDQNICLNSGDPLIPAVVASAACGPQVSGTERPTNRTALADLNPCPLNASCDIWGECGITNDFCTADSADTGAPGTAQPNSNGCISNCGTNITNNVATQLSSKALVTTNPSIGTARVCICRYENPPLCQFRRYESENKHNPNQVWKPSNIDTNIYTHIIEALMTDLDPSTTHSRLIHTTSLNISEYTDVFDQFVQLTGTKRILIRGVSGDERSLFATNVAQFNTEYDLDAVDFDWEHLGAPDIPGIPAGSPTGGPNYLPFLKLVRAALPDDKSQLPHQPRIGPDSGATPGECTQTAGYISNYEINEILSAADDTDLYRVMVETYVSEGDILVYNSTQWIL